MEEVMIADILKLYQRNHSGKENAITRSKFIDKYGYTHLWAYRKHRFQSLSDREFRQIYSQLPICTCEKGGFYPVSKAEIEEYRHYLRKKAIPLFERFNRVRDAHPEISGEIAQMELFERTENAIYTGPRDGDIPSVGR